MRLYCYLLMVFLSLLCVTNVFAQTVVTGSITDGSGKKLAHASVLIKGTTKGVTANADAKFSLSLSAGSYTIVCNYVGFEAVEKKIKIAHGS